MTTSPGVPSLTLCITRDDAERVLQASDALEKALESSVGKLPELPPSPAKENDSTSGQSADQKSPKKARLEEHPTLSSLASTNIERIFKAVASSENSLLCQFVDKMKSNGASQQEARVGLLIFSKASLPEKVEWAASELQSSMAEGLDKKACFTFFRALIMSVHSCIHKGSSKVEIEMADRESPPTVPTSHRKSDSTKTTCDSTVPSLQSCSPSFDSMVATSKDEDDDAVLPMTIRKEFDEIAEHASERLFAFSKQSNPSSEKVSVPNILEWKQAEGDEVVPWFDLLQLEQWKAPVRSTAGSLVPSAGSSTERPVSSARKSVTSHLSPKRSAPQSSHQIKIEAKGSFASISPRVPEVAPLNEQKESRFSPIPPPPGAETRTILSFDFTGSMPRQSHNPAYRICITEENLYSLRNLVKATGLATRAPKHICETLLGASICRKVDGKVYRVLGIQPFRSCLGKLFTTQGLSNLELDIYYSCFIDFFSCFDQDRPELNPGECDADELAVGFCFLCSGNKSSKLATGFDVIKDDKADGLTKGQLEKYLKSYLTMLVGISLLACSPEKALRPKLTPTRRADLFYAVESGARWTLGHYMKVVGSKVTTKHHYFETFAKWYTSGGYNVAPWLELLDLGKLMGLLDGAVQRNKAHEPTYSLPHVGLPPLPHATPGGASVGLDSPGRLRDAFLPPGKPTRSASEVLFTFPLASQGSLVVLKEDAAYVKDVLLDLGIHDCGPDDMWSSLLKHVSKEPPVATHPTQKLGATKGSRIVDKATFVSCMERSLPSFSRNKRHLNGDSKSSRTPREILANLFHSFDLHQIDRVGLNELMGGLTLLCRGKKSTKLAFAFGIFEANAASRPRKSKSRASAQCSLGGRELFLFLRSFLIVMFSCCRQSMDISDHEVGRYIADTANMVTREVMKWQWSNRNKETIDFDEFGEWYNEGGFESAPWLELLDLSKWIELPSTKMPLSPAVDFHKSDFSCPPAPPDEAVDDSFFHADDQAIMPMDSMDEMDMILMQPSQDKDADMLSISRIARSFSYSPRAPPPPPPSASQASPVKFFLATEGDQGGYMISVSQPRINHLRRVILNSGLHNVSSGTACDAIMSKATSTGRGKSKRFQITPSNFEAAIRTFVDEDAMETNLQQDLFNLVGEFFTAFDERGNGKANALELACGFTVLCNGKKSDKLEYAYEILDVCKDGNLNRNSVERYLFSFLVVLLRISFSDVLEGDARDDSMTLAEGGKSLETTDALIDSAVRSGSHWASSKAFGDKKEAGTSMSFDEFAEWYTEVGYGNIPWLELLDLNKWALS